ncbi:polyphosphate kinase [Sandaracinobacter neustonicus]|uniref:Polyphosphate kinase n=1 Tax=Sandaracinobacter neustonicus TaxID=1715348 RepID=A0A501XNK3_9SPHN|nr:polyphosphate kinase [Sandaracinobacter neustonicus]TPE62228.1 polyphosphate kinase [Sandaracinobacter neustonicus]
MAKGRLDKVEHRRSPDDYAEIEKKLQLRLLEILIAYHRQQRAAIILLEGWDAAGKGGLIKRLTAEMDPRFLKVVPVAAPDEHERKQHYLTRFWAHLPEKGNWTVFDRSWYGRVAVERVEGFASAEDWGRAYGEINAFESTLVTYGTRIVKLFLHISQDEQDERLIDRLERPWKRWKVTAEDFRNRAQRRAYVDAYEEMFERTDTEHARWHIIGANHKKAARIEGLRIIADALADGVDLTDPPLTVEMKKLAERELGCTLEPAEGG